MERPFSTRASALDAICFGSVMAWGAGKVWDAVRTLMSTTITNGLTMRMLAGDKFVNRESLPAPPGLSGLQLLYRHLVVSSFPARGILPEEREGDLLPYSKSFCRQIDMVKTPSAVIGLTVLTALPVIEAPMNHGWFHQQKAQLLSARHGARLIVEAPVEVLRGFLFC